MTPVVGAPMTMAPDAVQRVRAAIVMVTSGETVGGATTATSGVATTIVATGEAGTIGGAVPPAATGAQAGLATDETVAATADEIGTTATATRRLR